MLGWRLRDAIFPWDISILGWQVKDAIFLSPFGLSSDATASSSPFAVLQPCYTRSTIIVPPYVPSLTSALSLKQHRPPPKRDLLAMFRGAVHKHERASRLRKRLIKVYALRLMKVYALRLIKVYALRLIKVYA